MSAFIQKMKNRMTQWMRGRNGVDQLGWFILILAAALYLAGTATQTAGLYIAGVAFYGYCIFRMFSKNLGQRNLENRRFLNTTRSAKKKTSQFFLRLKNVRKYKYFHCPKCHVLMRLSRGTGKKTICCPKCRHEFTRKA